MAILPITKLDSTEYVERVTADRAQKEGWNMKPRFVTFHYQVKDTRGQVLESSFSGEPLMFLEGKAQIIPALEHGMRSMGPGEKGSIPIHRSDAYGVRDEKLVMRVPLEKLPAKGQLKIGQRFSLKTKEHGTQIFRVIEVTPVDALLDANHPLAGKDLVFDVQVLEVRPATKTDLMYFGSPLTPARPKMN